MTSSSSLFSGDISGLSFLRFIGMVYPTLKEVYRKRSFPAVPARSPTLSSVTGKGPTDPTLRFYYAVCLYEAGDFAGAAEVASTGLDNLQRPPFVESYLQKIRAARP